MSPKLQSIYINRARLVEQSATFNTAKDVVLCSDDGRLAARAAKELSAVIDANVHVLEGGMDAYVAAGLPVEGDNFKFADQVDDVWLRPYEQDWDVEQAMRDYLTWELGLVEQLGRDQTSTFWVHPKT